MSNESGPCLEQLDAENGKAWRYSALLAAVTIGIALHGSRSYGVVHMMGIIGGSFSVLLQLAQIIPGSCCLRLCERALVIRTLFSRLKIDWQDIESVSVQATSSGDRVVLHPDPKVGYGRSLPLHSTYRLHANTLADKLSSFLGQSRITQTSAQEHLQGEPQAS
jgi:hypothetical protein